MGGGQPIAGAVQPGRDHGTYRDDITSRETQPSLGSYWSPCWRPLLPLIAGSDETTFAAAAEDDNDFDKAVSRYKKARQESIEAP